MAQLLVYRLGSKLSWASKQNSIVRRRVNNFKATLSFALREGGLSTSWLDDGSTKEIANFDFKLSSPT